MNPLELKAVPFTDQEKEDLMIIIKDLERYFWLPHKQHTGAYSDSELDEWDEGEDTIFITFKYGVDGQWHEEQTEGFERENLKNLVLWDKHL